MASNGDTVDTKVEKEETGKSTLQDALSFLQGVVPLVLAIVVFILYTSFMRDMLGLTGTDNQQRWDRSLLLFSGFEAITFAAAGFLFGREVNRKRAESAEERAGTAETEKTEAERKAVSYYTRGRAVASLAESKVAVPRTAQDDEAERGSEPTSARAGASMAPTDIRELATFANQMFPEQNP